MITLKRLHTREGMSPYDTIDWVRATAEIKDVDGGVIFRQDPVWFPSEWSQTAINVVSQKYFRGGLNSPDRENHLGDLVRRVVNTITDWGLEGRYFDGDNAEIFRDELAHLILHQKMAFNSPVWFNVGVEEHPQASACMPYYVRINTDEGLIPIGELVTRLCLGEEFNTWDVDGNPTPIEKGVCQGKRSIITLELDDGSSMDMTYDHRVMVNVDDEIIERQAGDLQTGDCLVLTRRPLLNPSLTGDIDSYLDNTDIAWLAGSFVGNGYSGRPKSATSDIWEIKYASQGCLDRAAYIMSKYKVPYKVTGFDWGWQIRGYGAVGRGFWEKLCLWDLTGNKKTPEWVFRSRSTIIAAYLSGLFDTDGCVVPRTNQRVTIQLSNTSRQVAESAQILLRSLGIFSHLRVFEEPSKKDCFTVSVNDMRSVDIFKERVGLVHEQKVDKLDAARKRSDQDYKKDVVRIVGKKRGGAQLVYDIQTKCSTFWAEGVLVHNCFINSVEDSMEGILALARNEGMLFKYGSGTGTNLSTLRSSKETVGAGGTASGPVSFMRGFDSFAGAIKSGGKCLTGDQLVLTDTGPVPVQELVDQEFNCVSYHPPYSRYVSKTARAWFSGYKSCVLVITNLGHFELSYDHPMKLDTEDYRQAGELKPGDRLFSCQVEPKHVDMSRADLRWKATRITSQVIAVTPLEWLPVYSVEVDCPTEDDKSPQTGHNYVIWSNDAGTVVSNTRRAAKMVILDIDHPDIVEFIECKADHEKRAWALIDAGYDGGFNVAGGAYDTVGYQNANHSVRVSDEFMQSVLEDAHWETRKVTDGQVVDTYKARDLMRKIAEAAHLCGDPGIQFDTTINKWHTCSKTDKIYASNPCSEFMFLDDTACNLASLNLLKFFDRDIPIDDFIHAVGVSILAMEIIVGNASYPTEKIRDNSHKFRPLGLGYANLGALLMRKGIPYDSDAGRLYAAAITSMMTAAAYHTSAEIARQATGPFYWYESNREPFLTVMQKHEKAARDLKDWTIPESVDIAKKAHEIWLDAISIGSRHGFRNAQATVLAPTGTIGFMMDCDTTGIEPDIALVKYKRLVGGGSIKIVNNSVSAALDNLGYSSSQIRDIVNYIDREETIEGAPHITDEHLPVFDCAFRSAKGTRSIHYMGHIRMMSAAQPFLSGAISKTVNLPYDCTVADIEDAYLQAWKLGLKAIAVYRDGCKRTQPLSTKEEQRAVQIPGDDRVDTVVDALRPNYKKTVMGRRRLPTDRAAVTHKFEIGGHEGYLTVGMYEDGSPGEIFLRMAKEGSAVSGLLDGFATAVSIGLQSGAPLESFSDKYIGTRFEPSGFTQNEEIRIASSVLDYVFRWLSDRFVGKQATKEVVSSSNPPCPECGTITVSNGSCHKCPNCGTTTGCS